MASQTNMLSKKQKASKLAEREIFLDKRNKLLVVLTQKLDKHYGQHTAKGLRKNEIHRYIDSFFLNHPALIEQSDLRNLNDLESMISELLVNALPKKELGHKGETYSVVTQCRVREQTADPSSSTCSLSETKHERDVNPWTLIETYQLLENEEGKAAERAVMVKQKQDMAVALRDQIKQKEEANGKEKAEEDIYLKLRQQEIRDWEEEQRQNNEKEKRRTEMLKKVRKDQIEKRAERKKELLEMTRAEELKEMEEIRYALSQEEEEKCMKKIKERQKWEHIKAENAVKIKERNLLKKQEALEDAKLMADMKAKMDQEESKRAKAIEDRAMKLEANSALLREMGAFKKTKEVLRMEQSWLKASEDRDRAQIAAERKKKEIARQKKVEMNESNKKMVEEKKRRELIFAKEKEVYAKQYCRETVVLLAEKEAYNIEQMKSKLNYRKILDEQIKEQKHYQTMFEAMMPVERSMNKKVRCSIFDIAAKNISPLF